MVLPAYTDTELVDVAQKLPAGPRLVVELGQAIRNPHVDAAEITALLRQDTTLVARIIRMANSPYYARSEPVGSIEEALACIGFREAHRMVGAVAATQLSEQKLRLYGMEGATLRANALFVAVIMEELAEPAGEEPRTCYTVGLLRSIGKMALEQLAHDDDTVATFAASGELSLEAWETRNWGMTNGEVAERVLQYWRLPSETVSAIRHHYHPEQKHNPVIHLLSLAAGAAEDRFYGLPGEVGLWQRGPEIFAKAGVTDRDFQIASERAQRTFLRLIGALA
ncbi:MAG: HDOD domain-containing protein [Opitutales bacterium]